MTKDRVCRNCPALIYRSNITGLCRTCLIASRRVIAPQPPPILLATDRERQRLTAQVAGLKSRYDESLRTIERQEEELKSLGVLNSGLDTFTITPKYGKKTSEATPIVVASDWHTEEVVTTAQTSGLNVFNADICRARVTRFFQATQRLIALLAQDVQITTVVLGLLGDFITNDLHEEAVETNGLLPMHAILNAQNLLASGLEFLLKETNYTFKIVCKVGNHGRTTKKVRFATENGHSLEHLMYVALASYFRHEPRLEFHIDDGYHQYVQVYDRTLRFHHGHQINYQGGIGGIFIPAFKAISQWDKGRHADLDVFGHFHSSKDGGKFISNGSLIGYNSFALSIKADYEEPKQQLFLIDKKRGRTCVWPIFLK
jgi:hypothetical protein